VSVSVCLCLSVSVSLYFCGWFCVQKKGTLRTRHTTKATHKLRLFHTRARAPSPSLSHSCSLHPHQVRLSALLQILEAETTTNKRPNKDAQDQPSFAVCHQCSSLSVFSAQVWKIVECHCHYSAILFAVLLLSLSFVSLPPSSPFSPFSVLPLVPSFVFHCFFVLFVLLACLAVPMDKLQAWRDRFFKKSGDAVQHDEQRRQGPNSHDANARQHHQHNQQHSPRMSNKQPHRGTPSHRTPAASATTATMLSAGQGKTPTLPAAPFSPSPTSSATSSPTRLPNSSHSKPSAAHRCTPPPSSGRPHTLPHDARKALLSLNPFTEVQLLMMPRPEATEMLLRIDDRRLLAVAGDTAVVWATDHSCQQLATLSGHTRGITCASVLSKTVATASHDQTIKLWDYSCGECRNVSLRVCVCLFVFVSACPPLYMSVFVSACLSLCLSPCLSVSLSLCLPICLCIRVCLYPRVCLRH